MSASSVSGDIAARTKADEITLNLVLNLALDAGAELRAESLSGEISVRLAQPPDPQVSLKTFSGSLRSEFGDTRAGERRKLEQTLGSGKGRIELNSFSGDLRLGKR